MDRSVAMAPLRVSVSVTASRERAFEVFTRDIGAWWPMATHSIEGENVVAVEMECREGGRLIERHRDGGEAAWGVITTWDPPTRVAFTWNPTYEDRPHTDVVVTFTEEDGGTRVELEHHGWERLGARGKDLRESYSSGWRYILEELYAVSIS
jgi:uncharacterized protein YndB with AHSA1/START domain